MNDYHKPINRLTLLIVALAFAFVIVHLVHADPIWQKAEAGMSPQQLAELYPQGSKVELCKRSFEVVFAYNDAKLSTVTLACRDQLPQPEAFYLFNQLTTQLNSKYGKPINVESTADMPVRVAVWETNAVRVKLHVLIAGYRSHVSITYTSKVGEESKL